MSIGDVRVFGLVVGTHVLEDIAMDVPHGQEVVIPADKAARSKDLYRALSQKRIFQMPDRPVQHTAPVTHIRDDVLQERNQALEQRNRQLETESAQLREALRVAMAQTDRLDAILRAIEGIPAAATVYVNGNGTAPVPSVSEVADGTAPQFIPDQIAPKDAQTRIEAKPQTGDSSGISSAADKLRELRNKSRG